MSASTTGGRFNLVFPLTKFDNVPIDGVTPASAAINAAIEAVYRLGGGILDFGGTDFALNVAGQDRFGKNFAIKARPKVSLRGSGSRLTLITGNASLVGTTDDPWSDTIAHITEDVTEGDKVFAVDDTAGFVVGRKVLFRGADSPLDMVESLTNIIASVVAIGAGTIELDRPAPRSFVAADVVGEDNGQIIQLDDPVDDITIDGFDLVGDVDGGANAEFGIYLKFGERLKVRDVSGINVGAGLVGLHTCTATISNTRLDGCVAQDGQASKGRMFTVLSCSIGDGDAVPVVIDGVEASGFEKYILFAEFGSTVLARNIHSTNNFVGRDNEHTAIFFAGENTIVDVDTLVLDGNASFLWDNGDVNGIVNFENVTDNTV
jgi:hypothetical protein